MRMLRLLNIATSIFMALTGLIPIASNASEAVHSNPDSVVFLLAVTPADDVARKGISSWVQLFRNNIGVLLTGIGSSDDISPSIAANIQVIYKELPTVSRSDLKAWWESAHSLSTLSAVATQDEKSTFVDNDIYLGDLKGTLTDAYLHVTQELKPGRYKLSRDALAIVTLYTYAMDAIKTKQTGSHLHSACLALGKAYLYQDDLDIQTKLDLDTLLSAVATALEKLDCRGKS